LRTATVRRHAQSRRFHGDGAQARFATITTSRSELLRLIKCHGPSGVVIEACALAGWVHDLSAEHLARRLGELCI
jgi:hypothetical protein